MITGASSGIGAAAARQLAQRGHRLVLVGRSPERTRAVAAEIGAESHLADFADLTQVRRLADTLAATYHRIDVLANNAGAVAETWALTTDRLERTFQVNYLAPFLLTTRLLPVLTASRATVIQTAGGAARARARLTLDDLQRREGYRPSAAFGNARLACVLFTQELQRRHGALGSVRGVHPVAFHPGIVATTAGPGAAGPPRRSSELDAARGADPLVWLAEGTAGSTFLPGTCYVRREPATWLPAAARDPRGARDLWDRSADLVRRRRAPGAVRRPAGVVDPPASRTARAGS